MLQLRSLCKSAVLVVVFTVFVSPAQATFHLWAFQEIFSNADGTVQFIELFTVVDGQEFASGEMFRSTQGASVNTFTFTSNTPSLTSNHHLLIATAGFAALPGVPTPDFIIPDGFLFSPDGLLENLALLGPSLGYTNLPIDGVLSLAGDGVTTAVNSPTNFNGDTGTVVLPVPPVPAVSTWGILVFALLVSIAGVIVLRRRPAPATT